jgi:putative FmdB family regulatory protein
MPLYDFNCQHCGQEFEKALKIVDRNEPLSNPCPMCQENGSVVSTITSPRIVSGVGDFRAKVPDVFKDRLREIKKISGRGNTIDV